MYCVLTSYIIIMVVESCPSLSLNNPISLLTSNILMWYVAGH